jgi:LuxR family transcriptional regulator, maltose regulon positive regulatory protein
MGTFPGHIHADPSLHRAAQLLPGNGPAVRSDPRATAAHVDVTEPTLQAVGVLDWKLHPASPRQGIVSRHVLVDRLLDAAAPIIAIVAPAGYGKSTVLGEFVERSTLPAVWLSLDEGDNDPASLMGYLAAALSQVEAIDAPAIRSLTSPTVFATPAALSRFGSVVSGITRPFVLVIDNLEAVHNQPCKDAIVELALRLPVGSRLALASRSTLPLPMGRLRGRGLVVDLGVDDLAMDRTEAEALLAGAEVELSEPDLVALLQHTEGWPVGLYLAALAIQAAAPDGHPGVAFSGDDRLMADYLGSELLARLSPRVALFLMRTSVLERLSGPLCDAVLARSGSHQVLESLEESNLLLIPLDRQRHWYRYHHLFRQLLRAELMRSEPCLVPLLHDRAATWLEANGLPEAAVDHALAAGDADRAARLVSGLAQGTYAAGRVETATGWLDWFERNGTIERYPHIAILGAIAEALLGRPAGADRWADAAEKGTFDEPLPDGSRLDSWLALLSALLCRRGIAAMRADADVALERLAPGSTFRGPALFFRGMSDLLAGDTDTADTVLAQAVDVCLRVGATPSAAPALAERAVVAIQHGDWHGADSFAAQAQTMAATAHLDDYISTIVVHAVSARTAAHRGDLTAAHDHVTRAIGLRPLCTPAFPLSAQFLLQLGHACLELADPAGARAVLRQVRDILQLRPDLGVVPKQADELQRMLDTIREGTVGASSLTTTELRLLPFLATHLSYPDIAERMYVSRHTVKSHAMAVLRKLGVSSRREAIERAREIGLLPH